MDIDRLLNELGGLFVKVTDEDDRESIRECLPFLIDNDDDERLSAEVTIVEIVRDAVREERS